MLRVIRALLLASLVPFCTLRADAQEVIDDLDTGPSAARSAIRALWGSAPVVDVDPNEPGSTSAGLQEALGRCNGGAGACVLQLRANTTYTLPPHATWSLPLGAIHPRVAFHTNGADDVWIRGHGDSSVIAYTQVGSGPDKYLQNWIMSADRGSDRVLFSDFRIVRADQCTVGCQEYSMVFTVVGDVSDVAIDNVSVQSTQLAHDGGYPGRNIFMVFAIAYPNTSTANTPRRVLVQNSRFSMSSSGIHTNYCNDCQFVGNRFDAAGVPDDGDGATVRAFTTFKGMNYLIAKNAIDLAMDGRTSTNWTACIKLQGDQTFDPNQPQSQRINEGATVIGNACTGLRQSSAAGIYFEGYKNANVTGNHIYAGLCSNNALASCQTREDCGTNPAVSCRPAPAKAFYFPDMQWANANSNQGNVLRSNRFGDGTDCVVRIDASAADPNSNTGNTFVGNVYRVGSIQNQGFCGTGAAQVLQNTLTDNTLIADTTNPEKGDASAWGDGDRIDGAWLLSDTRCDDPAQNTMPIDSTAIVYLTPDLSRVVGTISGFGSQGDFVRIDYDSELPDTVIATDTSGKLTNWERSRLCVFIDDPAVDGWGGRDTVVGVENAPICVLAERCSVAGSATPGTRELTPMGTASAKCSGTDLPAGLSSAQLATIMAAFPAENRCGVHLKSQQPGSISSIAIKLEQRPSSRTVP